MSWMTVVHDGLCFLSLFLSLHATRSRVALPSMLVRASHQAAKRAEKEKEKEKVCLCNQFSICACGLFLSTLHFLESPRTARSTRRLSSFCFVATRQKRWQRQEGRQEGRQKRNRYTRVTRWFARLHARARVQFARASSLVCTLSLGDRVVTSAAPWSHDSSWPRVPIGAGAVTAFAPDSS